jgi:hypothetical protein
MKWLIDVKAGSYHRRAGVVKFFDAGAVKVAFDTSLARA